jgi:hypothetical protein
MIVAGVFQGLVPSKKDESIYGSRCDAKMANFSSKTVFSALIAEGPAQKKSKHARQTAY